MCKCRRICKLLSVLRSETQIRRLEANASCRLFRKPFFDNFWVVAAEDFGHTLRYISADRIEDGAIVWAQIHSNFDKLSETCDTSGSSPFWFVECRTWPPSSLLAWDGLKNWLAQSLQADRPCVAAAFSSEQLIVGFADSAEFYNRLSHAQSTAPNNPLFRLPFLLRNEGPLAIAQIDVSLGKKVALKPALRSQQSIELALAP